MPNEAAILQFSFVGYQTKEIVVGDREIINITLDEDTETLDEIVVTALGIKKETKALGYSLTQVDGEELSTIKQPNAINSLQGKVAGVNVTQNATGASGSSRVIIRGASSLNSNNQPLYVIDGIPISNVNNGSAGKWGGPDGGDGISSLNADDIKSVGVLKGGAASALYGSRASNGVIIVTTKSGKGQQGLGIELSSSATFENVDTSLQNYQTEYGHGKFGAKPVNAAEAIGIRLSSWGPKLDGSSVVQWDGEFRPYSYVGNNHDYFYRQATTFINTIAITGTGDNMNYRFSASNLENKDITPNSGMNRKSFSLNAGVSLSDKITSNINVKYIIEDVQNRPHVSDRPGNVNYVLSNLSPNVDVRFMNPSTNEDGTEIVIEDSPSTQSPYYSAFNLRNGDRKNRIIASSSLRYDVTDWLYLTGRVGTDHYTIRKAVVQPWGSRRRLLGRIIESDIRYNQIDADVILGAERNITDKVYVVAFVGANSNHIKTETLRLQGDNFIVVGLEDIANTANQSSSRRGFGERKIGSLYGSVEFSYNKLAYVTFTGRNDWFSTLSFPRKTSPNNDLYPSISASLILSEAFEMPESINFLKLRGGYSEVAGGAQNPYQLALTYQIFGQGHQGQPLGNISNGSVPSANLVAFSKSEFEIGVDARMFGSRLSLDLAYYKNKTTNDIVEASASVFSGYTKSLSNIGIVENKGIELLVSGTPVVTDNFRWNTSLNLANNIGTILATDADDGNIKLQEPRSRNINVTQIVGERYGTLFGVSYVRDDSGTIVYDIGDDGVPLAQEGKRKILGEGVPPINLGLSNSFTYKDFTLNFLIDGKFGGQIFSGTNSVTYGNGLHSDTLEGREGGLSVSGINGKTNQPFTKTVAVADLETYYGRISNIAEQFVYDSDFIKFRQLSIGYNFPQRFLKRTFITKANISFIATNLFFLKRSVDNIDPESAYNVSNSQGLEYFGLPATRSYGLNLNIKL